MVSSGIAHSVHWDNDPSRNSANFNVGESHEMIADTMGEFSFFCGLHGAGTMAGVLTVVPEGSGARTQRYGSLMYFPTWWSDVFSNMVV